MKESYLKNSIIDRDKDDKNDYLFHFGEKGQDRFYIDGYIITPIRHIKSFESWMMIYYQYKDSIVKDKEHKKIAKNYKMPKRS